MKPNGTDLHRVVSASEHHKDQFLRDPIFSPNGERICFIHDGLRNGIYTATASGRGIKRIAAGGAVDPHHSGAFRGGSPSWQPAPR